MKKVRCFFYMPDSIASLKANGYQSKEGSNLYWKSVADTIENIDIENLDSAQFTKSFRIRLHSKDTVHLAEFITKNADTVFLQVNHHLLVKIKGKLFFIMYGYSLNKKLFLITYRNIARLRDKVQAVNDLRRELNYYTDTVVQQSILSALSRIDQNWKKQPPEYYDGPPPVIDSYRNE